MKGNKYRLQIENVISAHKLIHGVFKNSPQSINEPLSDLLNANIVVKDETLNPVGSFKGRGAEVFVQYAQPAEHFFCASAGNFGQAMAYSCRAKQVKLTVYASRNANSYKIDKMREMGAEVKIFGDDFDAAKLEAKNRAKEFDGRFIEDSLDIESLEGAATIGLELVQLPIDIDMVLIALGNGALVNGVARVMKHFKPSTKIIAVQAKGASAMVDSWRSGAIVNYSTVNTIADGIAVRIPIPQALIDMDGLIDDAILVNDESIIEGMKLLSKKAGIRAEPSGAVGIAAILENPSLFQNKTVVTIVCGGNLSNDQEEKWLND